MGDVAMHTFVVHGATLWAGGLGGGVIPVRGGVGVARPPHQSKVPPIPAKDRSFQGGVGAGVDVSGPVARDEAMGPDFVWGEERFTIDADFPGLVGALKARGEGEPGA